tara:strand:+ start:3133 stop:3759 length:627 start_codon:yes stop_codon:yes gene_type:complete
VNVTKLTEEFVNQHPSIKDCLKQDILNFSKVARKIQHENSIENFEAIVIALRRLKQKIQYQEDRLEKKIQYLLKNSRIAVKNKIIAVVTEKNIFQDNLIELEKSVLKKNESIHVVQGSDSITIITTEQFLEPIKNYFKNKIIKVTKDLIEVTLKADETIEETPGYLAFLTSMLAENNINIVETMSTWTETLFVLDEKDITKTMELFKF